MDKNFVDRMKTETEHERRRRSDAFEKAATERRPTQDPLVIVMDEEGTREVSFDDFLQASAGRSPAEKAARHAANYVEGTQAFKEAYKLPDPTMVVGVNPTATEVRERLVDNTGEALPDDMEAIAAEVGHMAAAIEYANVLDPALSALVTLAEKFVKFAEVAKASNYTGENGPQPVEVTVAYSICARVTMQAITARCLELVPEPVTTAAPAPKDGSKPEASSSPTD